MLEFKLPDVGEGMEEAEIIRWLVRAGDTVRVDQPILEIQTDKALVEIPSPVAGKVSDIKVQEGQIVHVGSVLVSFETIVSQTPHGAEVAPAELNAKATAGVAFVAASDISNGARKVRAAPAVRKKALELDIDLGRVQASSPDGRVLMQDVLKAQNSEVTSNGSKAITPIVEIPTDYGHAQTVNGHINSNEAKREIASTQSEDFTTNAHLEERKPLIGLRRRIAERMEQSWHTIPHVTTFDDVDGEQLVALRQRLVLTAEKRQVRLTYLPLIVKAVVQALKQHPIFNSSLDEQTREVIYKYQYHIGLATATPDGLLVPVLRHADKLSLLQIATEMTRLTEGAKNRTLKSQELSGSTFTITNFGSFGGQRGTPIINPPEAAILGIGQIKEQVVARDSQMVIRSILPLSLSFDHRLIDGADGGAFTRTLVELLENPVLLMLEMV